MRPHVLALAVILATLPSMARAADPAAIARGAYLFNATDCVSCHTDKKNDGAPLAGGRPLATPFGTYYSPNITPDDATGIGKWTLDDFHRALRDGRDDDGDFLFPVFPFTSFTGMSDADIADLYAYLMAQPPVARPDTPHQVKFPFGWRPLLFGWRLLFFRAGPLAPVDGQSAEWNRGRYLVEAVAHCEECHTPRNFLGALDHAHAFAGNPHGPDGQRAPNITSDEATGIGKWSIADIETVLFSGQTPDFDSVGAGMGEVVNSTANLTQEDRHAIAVYLNSLPPLPATGK
jgi:mono/diheme cytochrome c family protein